MFDLIAVQFQLKITKNKASIRTHTKKEQLCKNKSKHQVDQHSNNNHNEIAHYSNLDQKNHFVF